MASFAFFVECEIRNCSVKCRRKLLGITGTNSTIPLINTPLSLCSGSYSMDWLICTGLKYWIWNITLFISFFIFSFFCKNLWKTWYFLHFRPCSNWMIHRDLKPSNILVWFWLPHYCNTCVVVRISNCELCFSSY